MYAPERQTGPACALSTQALDAQVRLLPYALAFFAICLPVLLCTAAFAPNRAWLGLSLGLYGVNWTAFYAVVDWLKKAPAGGRNLTLRTQVQMGGAALWAAAIAQTCWVATGAGPVSELLLILCAGASAGVIFFSAPSLVALITVGPAAAAGPVIGLVSRPQTFHSGLLALSGEALALALALILNRHLREHFALAAEREQLIDDRETALASAQALARSKSDLLATLSHEVRNGLSGVTHVLNGALGAGPRRTPSREQLRTALDAARSLALVVDATLDTEDAETGRLALAAEPLNLATLVEELVAAWQPEASAKGLELAVRFDDGPSPDQGAALGDPARVRQVVNNLLANAVRYTLRGRVEISLSKIDAANIALEVVDTGPGLTTAELADAFAPFRRVARTAAGVPGAGLGLSLSRSLAELMGGRLTGQGAPGVGSRFRLELPFDPNTRAADGTAVALQAEALRVMVIDEDRLAAAMLRAVLEELGHKVLHVQDPARGEELLRLGDMDLVVTDAKVGADAASRIRALAGAQAAVPIIALIGGEAIEAEAMLSAGADAVLRKPVTLGSVARALADARTARSETHPRAAA